MVCLPHARGGVSIFSIRGIKKNASSPRTWGCFQCVRILWEKKLVFPTHVGVFLSIGTDYAADGASSPRTWGCFFHLPALRTSGDVFPTHVGVFLGSAPRGLLLFCLPHARGGVSACRPSRPRHAGLPHARGGVSSSTSEVHGKGLSSPRTWGCFTLGAGLSGFGIVFPTHVGGAPSRGCPRKPLPHSWGFSRLPLT